jgi:hypothetical protein
VAAPIADLAKLLNERYEFIKSAREDVSNAKLQIRNKQALQKKRPSLNRKHCIRVCMCLFVHARSMLMFPSLDLLVMHPGSAAPPAQPVPN